MNTWSLAEKLTPKQNTKWTYDNLFLLSECVSSSCGVGALLLDPDPGQSKDLQEVHYIASKLYADLSVKSGHDVKDNKYEFRQII